MMGSRYSKGSMIDALYIVITIFAISLVLLIVQTSQHNILGAMNSTGNFEGQSQDILEHSQASLPKQFQNLVLIVMFGLGLLGIVLAFNIESHPIYYFIFVFMMVALILISPVLSNIIEDVSNKEGIYEATQSMGALKFAMSKLPIIIIVITGLIALAMFTRGGGGG